MTDAGEVLPPGTRLEEFEIERYLNAGGFGVTYLAHDLSLDARRVVKEYLPRDWGTRRQDGTVGPRTSGDEKDYRWGLDRFLDEAKTLARFQDPHIVHVYRVIEAWGTAFMVMEHVEGRTLRAEVESTGLLSESRVRALLGGLLDGLSVVHAADMLHRDIKPENVMVRPDGQPVLIDFGSARQALGEHSGTLTGVLTPNYAPIEQYPPGRKQGPWTDIYSLGAVVYWAVSGEEPEVATVRVEEDSLRPLLSVAPGRVSEELSSAVSASLRVFSRDRPRSVTAWRELLAGDGTEKPDEGAVVVERESRRWWPVASAVGLAAVVLAVVFAVSWSGMLSRDGEGEGQPQQAELEGADRPAVAEPAAEAVEAPETGPAEALSPSQVPAVSAASAPPPAVAIPSDSGEGREERSGATPSPSPEAVEAQLDLDRSARRAIQEGLRASGFDPGVADGLFGPGTRSALREWQSSRGLPAMGYLDPRTVSSLRASRDEASRVEASRAAEAQREAELEARLQAEREAAAQAAREEEARLQAEREAAAQAAREEEARLQAEREAAAQAERAAEAGRVFSDCADCPEMVVLAGGDLAMGRYEVTVGEYRAFASATGAAADGCRGGGDSWRDPGFPQTDRHPVVCVNWNDAQEYVSWLSRTTGAPYRLPTESEWARAASGSQPGCDRLGMGTRLNGTCPVGGHGANAAGLLDMVGNVWEWTSDCWEGNCGRRVVRGGSWFNDAESLRPGARSGYAAGNRYLYQGFRVSRTLD